MSIEAMKQALEALENSIDDVRDCLNQNLPLAGYARYDQRIEWYREQITKHEDAITSLRQAIEQAEKQEPMAWGVPNTRITERQPFMMLLHSTEGCQYPEMLVPLYTTPQPQREWVGLTDEDRLHLVDTHVGFVSPFHPLSNDDWINYASAIEAKLKEKNA